MPADPRPALTPERQRLVLDRLGPALDLARRFARGFRRLTGVDWEAEAYLALAVAARAYPGEPVPSRRWALYAHRAVRNALCTAARGTAPLGYRESRAGGPPPRIGDLPSDLDDPRGAGDASQPAAIRDELDRLLGALPEPEARLVRLIALEGRSRAEAARALGCSQSQAGRMYLQAVGRLRGDRPVPDPPGEVAAIRTPGQERRHRRNLVIAAARRQGCSHRLLAEVFDLPRSRIGEILREMAGKTEKVKQCS